MKKQEQISITYRVLTSEEVSMLNVDIKKFPDLKYVSEKRWKTFGKVFIAELKGEFAGVCVDNKLNKWCKIGPIVVLEKFQGHKIANALLNKLLTDLHECQFYITSSNESIIHLAKKLGFEERSLFALPIEIYGYIISLYSWLTDKNFWKEYLRKKRTYGLKKHRHFIKWRKEIT